MRTLLNTKKCPKFAYYGSLGLTGSKSYKSEYKRIISETIASDGYVTFSDEDNTFQKLMETDRSLFTMNKEKELSARKTAAQLNRMSDILMMNGYEFMGSGKNVRLNEGGRTVNVGCDMFLCRNSIRYAVRISLGKTELSTRVGENYVGYSEELYGMYKAFPDCVPAIYTLQAKNEGSSEIPDTSDTGKFCTPKTWVGKLWFEFAFNENNCFDAEARYQALLDTDISSSAEENNDECFHCRFAGLCQIPSVDHAEPIEETLKADASAASFTEEQKAVIRFRRGEARVLAGAGAGKTTTISSRVAAMIKDGIPAESVLMITFTDKAAEEMRERLAKALLNNGMSGDLAQKVTVTTFNGYGFQIIQKRYAELGFTAKPQLIEETTRKKILAALMDEQPMISGLNYADPYFVMFAACGAVIAMARIIEVLKRRGCASEDAVAECLTGSSVEKYLALDDAYSCSIVYRVYQNYQNALKEKNLVDYQDQISYGLLAVPYEKPFRHIIIDEFQDTSEKEMELVKALYHPSPETSLMVIGDDAQGIYGFRDVSTKNILEFNTTYPNAVDLPMLRNFRSTVQIMNIANHLISFNAGLQADKDVTSSRNGPEPEVFVEDERANASVNVADTIQGMLQGGMNPEDIAVLARTRKELVDFKEMLTAMKIPAVISVAEMYHDDPQILAAAGLAGFLYESKDLIGLSTWLRVSKKDEFDGEKNLTDYIGRCGTELRETYSKLTDKEQYQCFMKTVNEAFPIRTRVFEEFLQKEKANDLPRSFQRIAEYLTDIADQSSTASVEADETKYHAVTLSTMHSAKGREWSAVILMAYGSKALPKKKAAGDREYDPEEIRTLFVGVTRAKRILKIYTPEMLAPLFDVGSNSETEDTDSLMYQKAALA
jgi:DNA helicase-2/ATP-dependent DNA helicase PcrA